MKKLTPISRILLGLSALLIIIAFYTPIWKIELKAPQYPEGLAMQIWLNNITGQVEIINGLNHYIGMQKISVASFPEFAYMPIIVGILIAAGLIASLAGRRVGLVAYLSLLALAAAAGLYDFYQWSYDYGHNLDPMAPIQVPGLTYQPPLIGYKNLLNFQAFSFPDIGGLAFFVAGLIATGILGVELFIKKNKLSKVEKHELNHSKVAPVFLVFIVSFLIFSCSSGPEALNYGKDGCQHCRMTLMDEKFGCEIVNKNGKSFKFDDIGCLMQFTKTGSIKADDISKIYVVDFNKTKELIPVEEAQFLLGEGIKAPMASKLAAFHQSTDIKNISIELQAKSISWEEIQSKY